MIINGIDLPLGKRALVMGILNVTPDSFSDGGRWEDPAAAVDRAAVMIDEGADIIDVGGESTRPGHIPVDAAEEIDRVIPVIEALRRRFAVALSIDTMKAAVARRALAAGAGMVNDVWGLQGDPEMAGVIAQAGVPCCLMHNRREARYRDLLGEVKTELQGIARCAEEAGIDSGKIVLDPGFGFGKTPEQNLCLLAGLSEITALGYPVLVGASRKSMIGKVLDLPPQERLEGTLAVSVMARIAGAGILRVHDVRANRRALAMTDAVAGQRRPL